MNGLRHPNPFSLLATMGRERLCRGETGEPIVVIATKASRRTTGSLSSRAVEQMRQDLRLVGADRGKRSDDLWPMSVVGNLVDVHKGRNGVNADTSESRLHAVAKVGNRVFSPLMFARMQEKPGQGPEQPLSPLGPNAPSVSATSVKKPCSKNSPLYLPCCSNSFSLPSAFVRGRNGQQQQSGPIFPRAFAIYR